MRIRFFYYLLLCLDFKKNKKKKQKRNTKTKKMGPLKVLTSTCKFQAANLPFSLPPLEYEKISTHYYVIITFFFFFFFPF